MQQGKVLIEWDQILNERKKKSVLYFQDSYDPLSSYCNWLCYQMVELSKVSHADLIDYA